PTGASSAPATGASPPLKSFTTGRGVQSALVSTNPKSPFPGNVETRTVPCASWLNPAVVAPTAPQWPAVTKPPSTENPIEQRNCWSMKYGSPPRMSNSGFGVWLSTTTRTASAGTPFAAANALASRTAARLATSVTLFVFASTYQPVTPASARAALESRPALNVLSVSHESSTSLGVPPAAR